MITLFLLFVFGLGAYCHASEGNWGSAAICIGIIFFLLMAAVSAIDDAKAYVNRREYWSKSGPERIRMRRRWEEEADRRDEREREIAREKAARRAERAERRRMLREGREEVRSVGSGAGSAAGYLPSGEDRDLALEMEIARLKRQAYIAKVQAEKAHGNDTRTEAARARAAEYNAGRRAVAQTCTWPVLNPVSVCPVCGAQMQSVSFKVLWDGRVYREFYCPGCSQRRSSYVS